MAQAESPVGIFNVQNVVLKEKKSGFDASTDPALSGSGVIFLSGGAAWFSGTSATETLIGAA